MIRINLIPPEYAAAQAQKEQKIIFGGLGAAAVVLMLLFWGGQAMKAKRLEVKIGEAEGTLRQYQAIVDQINDIESKKAKLTAKRDVIVGLNRSRLIYPVFFEDLLPLIPSDVWVADVQFDKQAGSGFGYKLSSRATSNFAVATLLSNLQQSPNFSGVKIDRIAYENSPSQDGQSILSFQLMFSYQRQGPMPLSEFN